MKRMNLRDVPDDVYATLTQAAADNRQSLSAYVVDRLAEAAAVAGLSNYVASYTPPKNTGVAVDDAVAAVRAVRDAS